MGVSYCIAAFADGEASFYGGDVVNRGMTLPTFVDVDNMVTYSDIDDCYSQLGRLKNIYPSMKIEISRYVEVD